MRCRGAAYLLSLLMPVMAFAQTKETAMGPQVVSHRATIDNMKYTFGVAPLVAHLKPGNTLDPNSLDCAECAASGENLVLSH